MPSDAFVAAFLPGGEGGGVADVILRKADGSVRNDFRGKLSYSWPRRADQTPLNVGDKPYDPLFAFGYGLRYGQKGDVPMLSEERPAGGGMPDGVLFGRGTVPQGWSFTSEPAGGVTMKGIDRRSQEDSRQLVWSGTGPATAIIRANPLLDLSRETVGQLSLVLDYRVDSPPTASVTIGMGKASVPITGALRSTGEWRSLAVPLGCFERGGADMAKLQVPLTIATSGRLGLTISDARILSATVPQDQCGAP